MSEKLIIKNFGPIKSVELELKKFNVLIGEQATGKSTVAKVLSVCRYFSYIIDGFYSTHNSFEAGLNDRGMAEMIKDDSYIFYECDDYIFVTQRIIQQVTGRDQENGDPFEYDEPDFHSKLTAKSKKFKNLLSELKKIEPEGYYGFLSDSRDWIPTSFYQNDVAQVMNNPFFLPTERGLQSIFSLGKSTIQNISDSLFNQLADLDRIAREFKSETTIEPLNIVYKNVNGHGYVKKFDQSKFFTLKNGASGYQSTIPVVLVTKYYSNIRKKGKTFIIEEPELNLFPSAQSELMSYLVDKTINYNNQILLTTHSPYILTPLNNLIFAREVGEKKPQETANKVERKYWIDTADVSAYRMLNDGTCKNILDEETGLIRAEEIDEVSNILNETFDQLCELEYGE